MKQKIMTVGLCVIIALITAVTINYQKIEKDISNNNMEFSVSQKNEETNKVKKGTLIIPPFTINHNTTK